jgi:hypothetical protein
MTDKEDLLEHFRNINYELGKLDVGSGSPPLVNNWNYQEEYNEERYDITNNKVAKILLEPMTKCPRSGEHVFLYHKDGISVDYNGIYRDKNFVPSGFICSDNSLGIEEATEENFIGWSYPLTLDKFI